MSDEAEAGRRRSTAPAPPPRQSSRPPEPRPRTHVPAPAPAPALLALPAPPRLIRPSEHLTVAERNRQAGLSPVRSPENRPDRSIQSQYHSPVSPENAQREVLDRRTGIPPPDGRIVEYRPHPMDRRQTMPHVESASVVERAAERRPPPLTPAVTVLQGPRPTLPPPVPGHRSVVPPLMRMPAPIQQPVMRLPHARTDIQVWTDKKYLAKQAAGAARRSASSTGGGPSTAPPISQWESRIISIMGDGFGEPQTTARVPAFVEPSQAVSEPTAASLPTQEENSLHYGPSEEVQAAEQPDIVQPGPSQEGPVPHSSTRRLRRQRGQSTLAADRSVRNRLFQLEEQRVERERHRNEELAGIKMAVLELCSLMRQLIEQMQQRNI